MRESYRFRVQSGALLGESAASRRAWVWVAAGAVAVLGVLAPGGWLPALLWVTTILLMLSISELRRRAPVPPFALASAIGIFSAYAAAIEHGWTARALLLIAVGAVGLFALVSAHADRRLRQALARILVLMMLVAYFSSSVGGAGWMRRLLESRLGMSHTSAGFVVAAFRKSVHFGFYGLAGLAAWSLARRAGCRPGRAAIFGVGFALVLAAFDEFRQSWSAGRGASGLDVTLDLAGATAFVAIATLVALGRRPAR